MEQLSNNSAINTPTVSMASPLWGMSDSDYSYEESLAVNQVFEHYASTLESSPHIERVLLERGIDQRSIDQFALGFSNRSLGEKVPPAKVLLGSQMRGMLQRLGLIKPTGYELFQGAVVFPFTDAFGQIVGAYGRRLAKQPHGRETYHLYWNADKVALFNNQVLPNHKEVILCKSPMDAITLIDSGFDNVVATMGIKGFNDVQLSELQSEGIKSVVIAFGNTPEENQLALTVAQALSAFDIKCRRALLPFGHDINSFAMSTDDWQSPLSEVLLGSEDIGQNYLSMCHSGKYPLLDSDLTIRQCIKFYLDNQKVLKADRTFKQKVRQLNYFIDYCDNLGIESIDAISADLLSEYQIDLNSAENEFTGEPLSQTTQYERMEAVSNFLRCLNRFGIIKQAIAFSRSKGVLH